MAVVLIIVVVLGLLIFAPQIWVTSVIERHSVDRPDFPGTGGELARHVLDGMGLQHVKVEETKDGDHYDPDKKAVRLLPDHLNGRSLSAVVIAAHEVGHAMQDATGYTPLRARTSLARKAHWLNMAGMALMIASPLVLAIGKAPQLLILEVAAGLLLVGTSVLMHVVTLPVEFDASFRRALPLLEEGRYLTAGDMPAARQILRAAAFTYVASAAMSVLSVLRWFRI